MDQNSPFRTQNNGVPGASLLQNAMATQPPAVETSVDVTSERPRTRGFVIRCDGEHAVVNAEISEDERNKENYWAVGQLISIRVGNNRVVGLCCKVEVPEDTWSQTKSNEVHVTLELVGEIVPDHSGEGERFSSGITTYPQMGCVAHRIRSNDLEIIYKSDSDGSVKIGSLTQDSNVDAKVDIDKLLSRHFSIVGTTGVGKSTSVTLLLRKIVAARPDIRVLMLDPHNEFATAFPDQSVVVDSSNLVLPFWLFKLDEFAEVVFRGQDGFDAEMEILRDLIPQAKEIFKADLSGKSGPLKKRSTRSNLTADMPLPYRLPDWLKLIDDRLGQLDNKQEKPLLRSLQYRLESISTDSRFRFMFDQTAGGDVLENIVSEIFRVPQNGRPICVLEMSGLPSEVVNSVVSVLCRLAFDLALNSEGGIQTLVVCEEAHRYIPSDLSAGFWPTRQAIARIAKEGRKYGVFLSIITQRPGELDATILSQCNTIFAMRLGNQQDQEIIRGAVTNGAKSTIGFLSSIANRECIAFGEAIKTPMRMVFETIAAKDLPGAHIYKQQEAIRSGAQISLSTVLRKMRQEGAGDLSPEAMGAGAAKSQGNQLSRHRQTAQPGEDINEILNAAYSGHNTSLTPNLGAAAPSVETPVQSAPQPSVPKQPAAPKPDGAGNLIRSFRNT